MAGANGDLERRISEVILRTSTNSEFELLLISRDLMKIEPNGVHFRRLCFFELFGPKIRFFDLIFFTQILTYFFNFC